MTAVTVFFGDEGSGTITDFDVAPRLSEEVMWRTVGTAPDMACQVVAVRHERGANGFFCWIRIKPQS